MNTHNIGFYEEISKIIIKFHQIFTLSAQGGPRGRVGKVAVFQRSLSFDHLTAVSGVGSSPALATCETRKVLLAGVSGGFPGYSRFAHLSIGSSL